MTREELIEKIVNDATLRRIYKNKAADAHFFSMMDMGKTPEREKEYRGRLKFARKFTSALYTGNEKRADKIRQAERNIDNYLGMFHKTGKFRYGGSGK